MIIALVEEIYTAQQIRDKAMLQRLELANRERDMAIAKLKETEVHSDGFTDEPTVLYNSLYNNRDKLS